jgi:hypothetical protein
MQIQNLNVEGLPTPGEDEPIAIQEVGKDRRGGVKPSRRLASTGV